MSPGFTCAAIAPAAGTPGGLTGFGDARVTFLAPAPIFHDRVRVCDVIAVASSTQRACAIDRDGRLGCWELDLETIRARGRAAWTARIVPDLRAAQVSVAETHACAVDVSGRVVCWGSNHWGALCDGTTEDRTSPVAAIGVADAVMVSTRGWTTCILRSSGAVVCCGKQRR